MKKSKNLHRTINLRIDNSLYLLLADLQKTLKVDTKSQLIRFALYAFCVQHGLIDKSSLKEIFPDTN